MTERLTQGWTNMCGIVGYIGEKDTTEVLLTGLKNLEYRGYDSAGIAVYENGDIQVLKTKGRLRDLEKKIEEGHKPAGPCGIGHTRWATHGEPSDINSHPHSGEHLTLVHNGIIENYMELKEKLESKGVHFDSETDTEVAAKLLDYYYKGDPLKAITRLIVAMRGSYALAILFKDFPDRLYAVRKDSPLIVGLGEDDNYIASDVPAILKYTRDYYLLEENEIAEVKKESVKVFTLEGEEVKKERQTATWDVEAAEKGGYPHFMLKEIFEQPKAIRNTVSPRVKDGLPAFEDPKLTDALLSGVKKIHIVACGSAMHAGVVGRYAIEKLARIPVEVDIASEFRYRDPIMDAGDLVVIISQSGETADTLAALRLAKSRGAHTLAVVNVVGSSIAREADSVIYTWAGPEIAVATTKGYSVQLSVMYLLAIKLALLGGKIDETQAAQLTQELQALPDMMEQMLQHTEKCQYFASLYQNAKSLFFIGRGMDYALSLEGALKLKEISYIHAEAYAAGELKHGTISLIFEDTPVVACATQSDLLEKTVSNVKEVKARGGHVLLLCKQGTGEENLATVADHVFVLPPARDFFMPILAAVPLQLFAYYTAVLRGCDVDKPRNLAKSVTVE